MSGNTNIVAEIRVFLVCDTCKTVAGPFGGTVEAGFYIAARGWSTIPAHHGKVHHMCGDCNYAARWALQLATDRADAEQHA